MHQLQCIQITLCVSYLTCSGIPGPDGPVACKIFGVALDLKGKEKFLNQVTVQSYCGCSHCLIHYDQGPGGPVFSSARRLLPPDDPLRNQRADVHGYSFVFRNDERRGPPAEKTTQTVFTNAAIAESRGIEHYLGQKGLPMLARLRSFVYEKFNLLEWMHNLARAYENFLELLVGRDNKYDERTRATCRALGLFPSIWETQYLSAVRTQTLGRIRDDTITRADANWCRRWLRLCAVSIPAQARVQQLRDQVTELRDTARRGERVPLRDVHGPMPWRLSKIGKEVVNKRVAGIAYPHYTPVCGIGEDSFIKRTGCWRTASKLIALCVILVPALRGYVLPFRTGLRHLILGLRILEGQTFSINEARELKIEPGSKALDKSQIRLAKTLILRGLAMIEGSVPLMLLKPALHCLSHYAEGTEMHGILRLLWMMGFERLNKKCKNLTANKHLPFESLANSLVRDATAYHHRWMGRGDTVREMGSKPTTVVS